MRAGEIARRVADLDASDLAVSALTEASSLVASRALSRLATALVQTMSDVTNRGTPDLEVPVINPIDADAAVAESAVVKALEAGAPWLWSGPASGAEQRWIATGRPSWPTHGTAALRRSDFVDVASVSTTSRRGPLMAGLCTSGATATFPGMWDLFLRQNAGGGLWTKPWRTWRIEPVGSPRVAAIDSAIAWADLIARHHVQGDGRIHPDWRSIADEYDAVHLSPSAVCAIDGVALESPAGVVGPVYWTVETTLWLRWCFEVREGSETAELT